MLHAFRNLPIKRKLNLISVLSSAVAIVGASAAFVVYEQIAFRQESVATTQTLARMLAIDTASALSFGDVPTAEQTLRSLGAVPRITGACVYDASGRVFATYRRDATRPLPWPAAPAPGYRLGAGQLDVCNEITLGGDRIGTVFMRADLSELETLLYRNVALASVAALIALSITWLLATRLHRVISGPITHLADVAATVAVERNYAVRARKHADDELGRLVDVFNDMLAQIETRDAELEQRVAERTHRLTEEIRERTHAQEELKRSEYFLRKTQEVARLGSYVLDIRTGEWTSSPTLREVFGIDPSYPHDVNGWLGLVVPEERAMMKRYLAEDILRDHRRFEKEYRIIRQRDQEQRWASGIGELEFDDEGNPIRMIGTILDVTERKRAELAQQASEEKYRRLTEEISDVIWEVDANYALTYISPAVQTLAGYKPAEVVGQAVFGWFDEASNRRLRELIVEYDARMARGEPDVPITFEARMRRKDGTWVWIEAGSQLCRDGQGRFTGYRGTMRDISARKKVEAELQESQARLIYQRDQLQALLEASPDSIYFKDLQSRLVRVSRSKALKTIQGVPRLKERYEADPKTDPIHLVIGVTDFETYTPEDAQRAYDDEQAVIRTGEPIINKLERQIYQDGSVVWHLSNKMPWRDKDGKIIGTFGISKDITALKRAEEDLERVNRQLIEASRHAGMAEVATGVLHNVGNALNSVNVSTSVVLEQVRASRAAYVAKAAGMLQEHTANLAEFLTVDPKGQKLPAYLAALGETLVQEQETLTRELEELRRNVDHIKEIVAMQQTYARVAGVMEPVPIAEVVEDAIRMNSAALARHEVELIRDYATTPVITTDRHKVLQILVNLLRNAKYACDESGRTDKRITVSIRPDERKVAIGVRDNGIGIPPENLVRIFSHGFTTRKGGHGFGLHSGANAAKELGGALEVESAGPGQGASFTIQLPLNPPVK
ncbi:MAG TPA: PAS domain S-box protein [Opitutaceae bacterium]|nr:PAS domain S-box protein [Opitutaceae bacterium]